MNSEPAAVIIPTLQLSQRIEPSEEAEQVLLARQPIFDRDLEVVAHELLFRPNPVTRLNPVNGDQATSFVISNAFNEIGIQKLTGNKPAFINFTRNWLMNPPPFDPKDVVIEVLETVSLDDEMLTVLETLAAKGYIIALDDFEYRGNNLDRVLKLAHIVKIDVLREKPKTIAHWAEKLRYYNVKLLAEKVETETMWSFCKELGFDYYQGYFFSYPQNIKGQPLTASRLLAMQMLTDLHSIPPNPHTFQRLITQDPIIAVKLMRYIHLQKPDATFAFEDLSKMIQAIGIRTLRQWLSLIVLSKLADKPYSLLLTAAIRGKFCEFLSRKVCFANGEQFFHVGLFSTLNAFFDQELAPLLDSIDLPNFYQASLIKQQGPMAHILKIVLNHEQSNWNSEAWTTLNALDLDAETIESCYLDSIEWAQDFCKSLFQ